MNSNFLSATFENVIRTTYILTSRKEFSTKLSVRDKTDSNVSEVCYILSILENNTRCMGSIEEGAEV